jgi:uncharacterized protein YkwD
MSDSIDPNNFNSSHFESILLNRINAYRVENGASPLEKSTIVDPVATDHSKYLRSKNELSHNQTTKGKRNVQERFIHFVKADSYTVGENIAQTYVLTSTKNYLRNGTTIVSVVSTYSKAAEYMLNAWIQSTYHNKNILKAEFSITSIA